MQNYILNEGYQDNLNLFYNANGSKIFLKKKKFIDLSMCAGSIILGHNHPFLKKTINKIFKKKISNLAALISLQKISRKISFPYPQILEK